MKMFTLEHGDEIFFYCRSIESNPHSQWIHLKDYDRSSPPSPIPSHNGFPDGNFSNFDGMGSLDSRSTARR